MSVMLAPYLRVTGMPSAKVFGQRTLLATTGPSIGYRRPTGSYRDRRIGHLQRMHYMKTPTLRRYLGVLAVSALVVTGCSDADPVTDPTDDAPPPSTASA